MPTNGLSLLEVCMAFTIAEVSEVQTRRNTLRERKAEFTRLQLQIDHWRNRQKKYLESDIWHDVPENAHRWTIVSDYPAAVTDAYVAMLSSERPQVTTQPKRAYSQQSEANANYSEEIGAAIFDTINHQRTITIEHQVVEYATSRAEMVAKVISLGPDERGETRDYLDTSPASDAFAPENAPLGVEQAEPPDFTITEEGDFPVLYELLDPMDCFWTTGHRGRLTEFIYNYMATWDQLCDEFPDLYDHPDFKEKVGKVSTANEQVEVIDYWNMSPDGPANCIVIQGKWFKKPEVIDLPWIPIVVEEANAHTVQMDGGGKRKMRRGRPVCEYIVDDAAEESWLRSLSRSYIEQIPFQTVVVTGFDVTDPRNFLKVRNSISGKSEVNLVIDNAPGSKFVFFPPGMDIHYMELPQIVPTLQEMKQTVNQSMQNLTLPEAVLSGAVPSETSGYAYYQMKQIPLAKIGPYELACNRFLSRSLEMILYLLVKDWDRVDTPLVLQHLTGQDQEATTQVEVTKEQFAAIGTIQVRMKVALPSNKEQEDAAIIQMKQTGLMSPVTAIDRLGYVQDADKEWRQAQAQTWIERDPQTQASVAADYLANKGITMLQPVPPPVTPQGGMVGSSPTGGASPPPPGAAMMAGQPEQPAMMTAAPGPEPLSPEMALAGANGGAPQLTPEQLMALRAMQGGP